MNYDYSRVTSLTPEQFEKNAKKHDVSTYTKSDSEDLKKIAAVLDLRAGVLDGEGLYLSRLECKCGRTLTFYDFVFTSIVDADHPKSFIVHTLLGSKFVTNKPHPIRCSNCNTVNPLGAYITPRYCCSIPVDEK